MTQTDVATTQVYRVYIKASPQAVWDAITKPEWTERYGYGGRVDFDLRPGARYVAYTSQAMRDIGSPDVAIDGEVIEADPPRKLVLSWRMVMDEAMAAEGFTRLTYEIEEAPAAAGSDSAGEARASGVTKLTLVHELGDATTLASLLGGQMESMGAGGGWAWVLSDLKSVLETGQSFNG